MADLSAPAANSDRLIWYTEQARQVGSSSRLCHITGWTTADDVEVLKNVFRLGGIHGAIRYANPPEFGRVTVDMLHFLRAEGRVFRAMAKPSPEVGTKGA